MTKKYPHVCLTLALPAEIRFYFLWDWGFSIVTDKDFLPKKPSLRLRPSSGDNDSPATNSWLETSQPSTLFRVIAENNGQNVTLHLGAPQTPAFPAFDVLSTQNCRELLWDFNCKSGAASSSWSEKWCFL